MTVLSGLKDGLGRPIGGLGDGELQWHSDQSYMLQPATGAALYALELLPCGRQDLLGRFARRLRGGLPRQLRTRINGTPGIFDYTKRLAAYGRESALRFTVSPSINASR